MAMPGVVANRLLGYLRRGGDSFIGTAMLLTTEAHKGLTILFVGNSIL